MVICKLKEGMQAGESERMLLERAKTLPVVYDEDSPELNDEMEKAFVAERKKKPYRNVKADPMVSA